MPTTTTSLFVAVLVLAIAVLPLPAQADEGGPDGNLAGPCVGFSLNPLWVGVDPGCIIDQAVPPLPP